ncbi:MAG: lysine transporter LysE [gamma proteobacterium symbiont of Ctena orbiculata]|nr:LysE family translocator [Candidatus Thiodiazotropha taylori]PUB87609.1 MAG: lysine transporter LysE [gamma proteobacterium symbiont of Ctena orbiculata]MBT2996274.1 LysE family translocator [Candidatus Thiodiazotropha taylori]MBT3000292.1 LysE family translocator [Candidatus Thiodiazotropha taylori]MBT3028111.1 LysE family translocator [Candidatus Thiodiazotropha taylori]
MFLTEFLLTSLIVVLMPGTGVLFTVSTGLTRGWRASIFAATGCTLGILPHLVASVLGLTAILHTSAVAFQLFKLLGVCYLFYLAWTMWKQSGAIRFDSAPASGGYGRTVVQAFLINILNPKLSLFFLAFLPQFVPADLPNPITYMLGLSMVFMLMTLVVFVGYGILANQIRSYMFQSPLLVRGIQRLFSGLFLVMGIKLAAMER